MRILKDDEYITIIMDDERSVLSTNWKEASFADIPDSYTRSVIKEIANYLATERPEIYFADQTRRGVVYTVDLQKWIADTLVEGAIAGGVKKCAIIQPADFIVGLSNEQTMGEVKGDNTFELKNFSDRMEAVKWCGLNNY